MNTDFPKSFRPLPEKLVSLTLLLTLTGGGEQPCHGDIITFQEPLIQLLRPQAGLTSSSQKARGGGRTVGLFSSVPTPTQCRSASCPQPRHVGLPACVHPPSPATPADQPRVLGRGRNLSFLLVNQELAHRDKAGMQETGKG